MRWLLTGAHGLLGTDAHRLLLEAGHDVTAVDRDRLDITDAAAVDAAVFGHDVVLNCAGWTAVDDAEDHEAAAFLVNEHGPRLLARAASRHGARLVQISTDYVFDGTSGSPYREDAPTKPLSVYGRSKEAGERAVREELPRAHLVVRTAWLYGEHGRCFPRTILRLLRERGSVEVVTDQTGQPTWARDVAELVLRMVAADLPAGTYHATASGETTWCDFARAVAEAGGVDPTAVRPAPSDGVSRPAPRPTNSVLSHKALLDSGLAVIPDWRERWHVASRQVLRGV